MASFRFGESENIDLSSGADEIDYNKEKVQPNNKVEPSSVNAAQKPTQQGPQQIRLPAQQPPAKVNPVNGQTPNRLPSNQSSSPVRPAQGTGNNSAPAAPSLPSRLPPAPTMRPQAPSAPLPHRPEQQRQQSQVPKSAPQPVRQPAYQEPEQEYTDNAMFADEYVETTPVETPSRQPRKPVFVEPEVEDDDYEDDEEVVQPKKVVKSKTTSSSRSKKSTAKKNTEKKGLSFWKKTEKNEDDAPTVSKWSGGRKGVLIARIAIIIVFAVLCGAGIKSIVAPPQFPSADSVIRTVKYGINITDFPADKGQAFALNFAKAYLTQDDTVNREENLSQYATQGILDAMAMRIGPVDPATQVLDENGQPVSTQAESQSVVGSPFVTNVEYIDDNNAVITVQATVTTGSTLELSIPLYYDTKNDALAVSAPASILPAVGLATVPNDNHKTLWTANKEIAKEFEPDLTNYMKAWAASDTEVINRYLLLEPSLEAKTGLNNAVNFVSIEDLTVEDIPEEEDQSRYREAIVQVLWSDPNSPNITYKQAYMLTIKKTPDDKWNIKNITNIIVKDEN